MFEGKIKPCLKCGKECGGSYPIPEFGWVIGCDCTQVHPDELIGYDFEYQAVNEWNLANTPPEEFIELKHFYALYGMEIPR